MHEMNGRRDACAGFAHSPTATADDVVRRQAPAAATNRAVSVACGNSGDRREPVGEAAATATVEIDPVIGIDTALEHPDGLAPHVPSSDRSFTVSIRRSIGSTFPAYRASTPIAGEPNANRSALESAAASRWPLTTAR